MRRAPCSRNQRGMTAPWVTTVDATAEGLGAWLERRGQRRVLRREPGPPGPARAPRPTRGGSSGSRRSAARRGPLPDSGRCPRPGPAPLGQRGPPRGPPEGCIAWRGLEGAHPLEGGAWPCGPRMRRLSSDAPCRRPCWPIASSSCTPAAPPPLPPPLSRRGSRPAGPTCAPAAGPGGPSSPGSGGQPLPPAGLPEAGPGATTVPRRAPRLFLVCPAAPLEG
jgi:hypothetical protein